MLDIIKKALNTGIEIASLTKDKLEELGKDLVEKGKLSRREGEKLLKEIRKKSRTAKTHVNVQIEKGVQSAFKKMNIARRGDIARLEQKLSKFGKKTGARKPKKKAKKKAKPKKRKKSGRKG